MNPLWLLFFWRPFRRAVGLLIFLGLILFTCAWLQGCAPLPPRSTGYFQPHEAGYAPAYPTYERPLAQGAVRLTQGGVAVCQ